MRRILIFMSVVLVVGLCCAYLLTGASGSEVWDKDNFGKLIGQVIDAETGKSVNEVFHVNVYDSSELPSIGTPYVINTDKTGLFQYILKPGHYCLRFIPKSRTSKYCYDSLSSINAKRQVVTISTGKVTEFIKKIYSGGQLLIKVVDPAGNLIDVAHDIGNHARVSIEISDRVEKEYLHEPFFSKKNKSDLNVGEYLIYRIRPGRVNVNFEIKNSGYGELEKKDVEIKGRDVREVIFTVDLNDRTGVEGRVVDKNGVPIVNIMMWVSGPTNATVFTDSSGHFKFIGLQEGLYELNTLDDYYEDIKIIKNVLLLKNITINKKRSGKGT